MCAVFYQQGSPRREVRAPLALWVAAVAVLLVAGQPAALAAEGAQKFAPNLYSLRQHQVPDWFHDAKLGLFPVWGLYSVPGWAPPTGELGKVDPQRWFIENPYAEWYWNTMEIKESPTWKRHLEVYGKDFQYEDFVPVFLKESEKWNPDQWAKIFKDAGARYVVFTTKFHDGYPLWPSQVENPNRRVGQLGAARDYVGELTAAVRRQGMKMGVYYSGGLDWTFLGPPIADFRGVFSAIPQTPEYARYADAHWRELIERYQPSILWNDISYPEKGDFPGIVADYYNRIPEGVINNRFGRRPENADFTTPEYSSYTKITEKKWEATRGVGYSFGYNQAEGPEHVLSADALVDLLVDIVSKNGNLLLAVGPRGDGSIPEIQLERIRQLGQWLRTNGEAIYGTRYWVTAEGTTTGGARVRFTQKGDSVYALLLDEPKNARVTIRQLWAAAGTAIELLGGEDKLKWRQEGQDLAITLPGRLPGSYAYALKITPKPWKLIRE